MRRPGSFPRRLTSLPWCAAMTDVRGGSTVNLSRLAMPRSRGQHCHGRIGESRWFLWNREGSEGKCIPMFTRQPAMTARLGVLAAKDAPARITILCRVHIDQGLPVLYRVIIPRSSAGMRNMQPTSSDLVFSLSRRDVSWKSGSFR